jgi:hypothetical protein
LPQEVDGMHICGIHFGGERYGFIIDEEGVTLVEQTS